MEKDNLRAGVAKRDITTNVKDAPISDRLYVKSLVLDSGTTSVVIVTMDVAAIGAGSVSDGMLYDVADDFLDRLRGEVEGKLGIPGANVLVNASHTHPPGRMLCDDDEQVKLALEAIVEARESSRPAKIGSGIGRAPGLTINRTLRMGDGSHWTARHTNPSPPDDEVVGLGPLDDEVGVVRVDSLDGDVIAVLYNFACHPLFGDAKGSVTANYPGVASEIVEKRFKDSLALFLQGAAGDVMDLNFKTFSCPRDVRPMGMELGLKVVEIAEAIETSEVDVAVVSKVVEFPKRDDCIDKVNEILQEQTDIIADLAELTLNFKTFLPLFLKYQLDSKHPLDQSYRYLHEEAAGKDAFASMDGVNRANIAKYLANIARMERLARLQDQLSTLLKHDDLNNRTDGDTLEAELQALRLGDCAILASPLELLTQIGLNLKKSSPFEKTFVAGYSNGYLHYGAPADYYEPGGYEVMETPLAPECQKIFERESEKLARLLLFAG